MDKRNKLPSKVRAKGFIKGFKSFIMKGNVVDLAVGVVIGGAFGKIITSLVNDIILPPIGVLLGGVEFRDLQALISSKPVLDDNGVQVVIDGISQWNNVYIRYGNLIQTILEFLIIAFAIYLVLFFFIKRKEMEQKMMDEEKARLEAIENESQVKEPEVVVVPADILLLTEIRDLLRKQK